MDISDLNNPFFIGVFMAFMIGPVFFMLIKTSIVKGIRAAIAFDVGVIAGDIAFILMAYYGSRSLLEKIKDDPRLFLIGGLVLIVYGIITYLDKNNKKEIENPSLNADTHNYLKLFLNGFLLNFINIGVLAFWLGTMIMVGSSLQMNSNAIFWFFVKVIIGYLATDVVKILLAKQLKKKLTPLVIYKIKRGMGVLLIVFGAFLMLQAFVPKEQMKQIMNKVELNKRK